MTQTLVSGATTITPSSVQMEPYILASDLTPVAHPVVGGGVVYSLRPGLPITNVLEMWFLLEATAFAAFEAVRTAAVWTYTDSFVPEAAMDCVVLGTVSIGPHPEIVGVWIVTVPISEVPS
jgi:hypothetical protein